MARGRASSGVSSRWTWGEIDAQVSALAAALRHARGDQGRPHPRPLQELRRDVLARCSPPFRLGAVWVPTNFRLMPDEVTYLAAGLRREGVSVPCRLPGACRRGDSGGSRRWSSPGAWTARRALRRGVRSAERHCLAGEAQTVDNVAVEHDDPCWFFFTSGTTGRSKAAVLTHGQMAFVVTNHLADLMPGHDRSTTPRWWWRRCRTARASISSVQAARGAATVLLPTEKLRHRRGLPAGRRRTASATSSPCRPS